MLVYHAQLGGLDEQGYLMTVEEQVASAKRRWGSGHYRLVARVYTDLLEQAYMLTNNVDKDWWLNNEVQAKFNAKGCRSTSVGDIIVDNEGYKHLVATVGFHRVPGI